MVFMSNMQLGKNGVTDNFISTLKTYFKNHKNVKISVLRNCEERKNMKKLSEKILSKLGKNYTSRIIGFTLAIKRSNLIKE